MRCRAMANDVVFEDTRERGRPIVFLYGGRPFTGGLCKGVEEAMASMRAGQAWTTVLAFRLTPWMWQHIFEQPAY